MYLRAGRVREAMADLDEVLAGRSGITTFDLAESMVNCGYALARQGRPDAARATLTEGIRTAREAQTPTLLPDVHQALAVTETETEAGNLPQAIRHVREVLQWTMARSDVIDTIGALHLAVVLAAKTDNPQAAEMAAAVRHCRLSSGLTPWPFSEPDYAVYEKELGVDMLAVPAGPLRPEVVKHARELALRYLRYEEGAAHLQATGPALHH